MYIPRSNGERPLGIPSVEDKIVQLAVKKILEAIFEQDFLDVSYGFRPNRNCHDALGELNKTIMTKPVNHILDMDISSFFDSVDHKLLMDCLKQRIIDPSLLRIIGRLLKAGIMEEGVYLKTDGGIPQGSILSPVLANIFLHYALDLWFQETENHIIGFAQLIRYADDFIICLQYGHQAELLMDALIKRLSEFGLGISREKSRIVKFGRNPCREAQGETFDFLGFTHYCSKTRKGKFKVGRKTSSKRFGQKMKELNFWLKRNRNTDLQKWWPVLRAKLTGHYNYYGINGNYKEIRKFYYQAERSVYKWVNRRSQKKSYNWKQFERFLTYNPLPKPKIYHSAYAPR